MLTWLFVFGLILEVMDKVRWVVSGFVAGRDTDYLVICVMTSISITHLYV